MTSPHHVLLTTQIPLLILHPEMMAKHHLSYRSHKYCKR